MNEKRKRYQRVYSILTAELGGSECDLLVELLELERELALEENK